ncbi:probable chitinase 2 isoform X2 [Contarinia nasturtii]|uniref:probable chitinase 2 isoform X2 n=1 Tax=Contarinia nasturtii TaxID=265458 RepID=UPI0012D448E2|nr:probable chitinase 2 isoform X2 [Contarinia nasturtii]
MLQSERDRFDISLHVHALDRISSLYTFTANIMHSVSTLLIIFSVFMLSSAKTGPSHNKVVVCYVSTWAVYRPNNGKFAIENIDPNLCTHLVYAFAGLDKDIFTIKSMDPWQDLKDNYGLGGYERITNLRQSHPHLKVSLAIGGWNEDPPKYSRMASDTDLRKQFVKSATDFVLRYKFDGLDLDWEFPTARGGQPVDKDNFVLLVKELKDSFRQHNLLLTSAFGASKKIIDEAYDIPALSKYLDFMHIMCYDYGGAWDRRVSANAPLKGQGILNVEYTIDYLIKLGASPTKIVMGLPFYGRTFVVNHLDGNFGDASNEIGFEGPSTREKGFMGYNEICALLTNRTSGWQQSYNIEMSQAIAKYKNAETGEMRIAIYDSSRSIAQKIKFAMSRNLGGAMVWSVDTDDFRGECDIDNDTFIDFKPVPGVDLTIPKRYNANYPLLRTINEATVLALDEISQEAHLPDKDKENEIPHGTNGNDKGNASTCKKSKQHFYFIVSTVVCSMYLRISQ